MIIPVPFYSRTDNPGTENFMLLLLLLGPGSERFQAKNIMNGFTMSHLGSYGHILVPLLLIKFMANCILDLPF